MALIPAFSAARVCGSTPISLKPICPSPSGAMWASTSRQSATVRSCLVSMKMKFIFGSPHGALRREAESRPLLTRKGASTKDNQALGKTFSLPQRLGNDGGQKFVVLPHETQFYAVMQSRRHNEGHQHGQWQPEGSEHNRIAATERCENHGQAALHRFVD